MKLRIVCAAALTAAVLAASSDYFERPSSFAIEVSLENSLLPRLPMHRNAITSLAVAGDFIIGGTSADSGLSPYLFAASLARRQLEMVFPLDEAISGQRAISSGFGQGTDGVLYTGTIPKIEGDSGHLLRVMLRKNRIMVTDLGVPLPGQGVFSVTVDPKADVIYGIAWPSGRFFSFHVADQKVELYNETAPSGDALKLVSSYVLKPEDYLSRRLVMDSAGRVYGSCPPGRLFRFDPIADKIELLDELPSVAGHLGLGRVDAWAVANGLLYGANAADGQLFTIDPITAKVRNLGKPAMMPRMKGIAFGRDGILYGVTGGAPGYSHVFTYDTESGFIDYGNPVFPMAVTGVAGGILWRGFQIETMTASKDGRYIVMGEMEALSQLMVFEVNPPKTRPIAEAR